MSRRFLSAAVLVGGCLLLGLSGCGGTSSGSPVAMDEAAVRDALGRALDCWKTGQPHDAPGRLTPPVRVADEDWLAGAQLADYQIGDLTRVQSSGGVSYWPVELNLKGGRGPSKRVVTYMVATQPELSVIRQD